MARWQRNPAATLAAIWSALFCAAHLYWASGGTAGLPADLTMSAHPTLFLIDLTAIPACLFGVLLAQQLGDERYRPTPFVLGSVGASLMLWHAGLNYLFLAARQLSGQPITEHDQLYALLYEPFWLVGGLCWLFAVVRYRRLRSATHSPARSALSSGVGVDLIEEPGLHLVGGK